MRLNGGGTLIARRTITMAVHLNGRETRPMTAPAPAPQEPEKQSDSRIYLFSLRLWIFCALLIVAYGLANYLLNWYVGWRR
jgi:hypothetical protein